jgi:protein TonB
MILAAALLALALSPTAAAEDDLGALLGSIPDAKAPVDADAEAKKKAAEEAAAAEAAAATDLPAYMKSVRQDVLGSWAPKKSALKDPKTRASFLVRIGASGELIDLSAAELSGNKKFDQSVLDAIRAAAPFPAPPAAHAGTAERGVVVELKAKQALKAQQAG